MFFQRSLPGWIACSSLWVLLSGSSAMAQTITSYPVEVDGRKCLLFEVTAECGSAEEAERVLAQFELRLSGERDPQLGRFCLNVVPWSGPMTYELAAQSAVGTYWVSGDSEVSLDFSKCAKIVDGKLQMTAIVGSFAPETWLESIEADLNSKSATVGSVFISYNNFNLINDRGLGESEVVVREDTSDDGVDNEAKLVAVGPNPFNACVAIRLRPDGVGPANVKINIYDLRGRRVWSLVDIVVDERTIVWRGVDDDGRSVGSGVYLVKVSYPYSEREIVTPVTLVK